MFEAFTLTLNQMLQILILLALGFAMNKSRLVSREIGNVFSKFLTMLFIPSMTLYSNMMECKLTSLSSNLPLVFYGTAFYLTGLFLSYPLSKYFSDNPYMRGVYRYALAMPNTAAVAVPIIIALFGMPGMFQFGLFAIAGSILPYSWGIAQMQPSHGKTSWQSNLAKCININTLAMVVGMILGLLGAPNWMPVFISDTVYDLSQCYIPVSLLLAGFSIADYPISSVFHNKKNYVYCLLRLLVFPTIFLLFLYIIKAPLIIATLTALTFASPCGMNVVVFPAAYKEDCQTGASMVLMSSLGSIITVPVIYVLTQMLFA